MRFNTFLPLLLLLPFSLATPTPTEQDVRSFTPEQEMDIRAWYDAPGWRKRPGGGSGGDAPHGRPSSPPTPSSSSKPHHGHHRHHHNKRDDISTFVPLGTKNDLERCPVTMMACPISNISPSAVDESTDWECVAPEEDLFSCGGCSTLGTGQDCTAIPSALAVSCAIGSCQVFSCEIGFSPSADGKTCIPIFVKQY